VVARALNGERRAIAQLITMVEEGGESAREVLAQVYPWTGRAHLIGVTGAPGSGKSTLVNEMAKAFRRQGLDVGIIAVDPTSPFSGGAILGDRIRMREVATSPHTFIRSMATRGSLGGLARATADAARVLDAAGFPVVLIETVGAGQSEVEIARFAHTTVVLQAPASGDEIQAIKAGILEVADIIVVNKADLPGADNAVTALQAMLDLNSRPTGLHHGRRVAVPEPADDAGPGEERWRAPVLKTCALQGRGVSELIEAIQAHHEHQKQFGSSRLRERERAAGELRDILSRSLLQDLLGRLSTADFERAVERILAREEDPYSAAQALMAQARNGRTGQDPAETP
jgi:LAO/AO transport system kinase